MIETIKKAISTFFFVLAGITLSATIFITIFFSEIQFTSYLLWEFIIMAFVCTLGNFIFYSKQEISKRRMKIRKICHYLYINLVVLGGAFLWGWITPGFLPEMIVMLLLTALVYFGVMLANLKKEEKTAEDLNIRLRKINSDEDEK